MVGMPIHPSSLSSDFAPMPFLGSHWQQNIIEFQREGERNHQDVIIIPTLGHTFVPIAPSLHASVVPLLQDTTLFVIRLSHGTKAAIKR